MKDGWILLFSSPSCWYSQSHWLESLPKTINFTIPWGAAQILCCGNHHMMYELTYWDMKFQDLVTYKYYQMSEIHCRWCVATKTFLSMAELSLPNYGYDSACGDMNWIYVWQLFQSFIHFLLLWHLLWRKTPIYHFLFMDRWEFTITFYKQMHRMDM